MRRVRRLSTLPLLLGVPWALARLVERVVVEGDSMRPGLLPGDRLVVVRSRRARPGDVVTVPDPRHPGRILVKRVAAGSRPGAVVVAGDNEVASTDSRAFGPVARTRGRVVYRYWPAARAGRVR